MSKLTVRVVAVILVLLIFLISYGGLVKAATSTYTVQPGDSLWKVARKYHTTVTKLRHMNNKWTNVIRAGQRLYVPVASGWVYKVKRGDSLWKIASRTGLSIKLIKNANGLKSNRVYIGQKLRIPTGQQTLNTNSNLHLLARVIHGEARGENYQGKVAVGAVLLNRVKSSKFPNTLKGVIFQKNAFESVSNGQIWLQPSAESYRAAQAALKGWDPTYGSQYFYNPAKIFNRYSWIWSRRITLKIGRHTFAV